MTATGPDGQDVVDLLPVGVAHIDATATIVRANEMLSELIGVPVEELVGSNLSDSAADDADRYAEMLEYGTGYTGTLMGPLAVQHRHADGSVHRSATWARNHLDRPDVGALVCAFVPEDAGGGLAAALSSIARGDPAPSTLELLAGALRGNPFRAVGPHRGERRHRPHGGAGGCRRPARPLGRRPPGGEGRRPGPVAPGRRRIAQRVRSSSAASTASIVEAGSWRMRPR